MSVVVGVIDYGVGNRRSVQKALEHVGASALVTGDHAELTRCDGLVLPGVGAFPAAMRNLQARGLPELIHGRVAAGVPFIGICLGLQLLFERSEEGEPTAGLGLLPGEVTWLRTGELRLPHIGWNEVRFERRDPLLADLPDGGCPFYHVHSLAVRPANPSHVLGTCEYGERFVSVVSRDRVYGAQFHPEKSSTHGLLMLRAFVELCGPAGATATSTRAAARA